MELKNAIEFLLYSYFGLAFDDVKVKDEDGKDTTEKVLDVAIKRAYADATLMGAYNTLPKSDEMIKKLEKAKKEEKDGTKAIKDKIEELRQRGKEDGYFKGWHEGICEEIRRIYKDEICCKDSDPKFTYGNAQKWVNMTLKYICILYKVFEAYSPKKEECEFCKRYKKMLKNYEECFHVPVDSYMIESVWDKTDVTLPPSEKIKEETKLMEKRKEEGEGRGKGYRDYHVLPWGKWEEPEYTHFQDTLRNFLDKSGKLEKISPLDWENEEWIKVARDRKKKAEEKLAEKAEKQEM